MSEFSLVVVQRGSCAALESARDFTTRFITSAIALASALRNLMPCMVHRAVRKIDSSLPVRLDETLGKLVEYDY
ncbi:MAG: hypothetical protein MUF06_06540 [Pirellulaceae bacterium]|jgi:hypothetical protein|nr:hypothetical protein [Pirellulaceae bacterium]